MKRPRPSIPMSVRVAVAERQAQCDSTWWLLYFSALTSEKLTLGRRLAILLEHLPKGAQLDHDPALILRPFSPRTGKYTPDANDPRFLTYREPAEHLQKTTGRKPGASRTITTKGSDIGIKTKFARLERKARATIKPKGFGGKRKIESRPFSKQKRGFK